MVVRDDAQLPPAVDHGQKTQVVVAHLLRRLLAEAELVEQLIVQQQLVFGLERAEDCSPSSVDTLSQLLPVPAEHELEQLRHALSVLSNLASSAGIEDGKTSVDVPLVAVDAKGEVHLHVLDAANVSWHLPGELLVGCPCGAHGEESSVGDSLCVRSDAIVHVGGEVYMLGLEAAEDALNKVDRLLRGFVVDDNERLAFGIDTRSVERVTRDHFDVGWEVLLEGGDLRCFSGCLATDDGTLFGGGPELSDNGVDQLSLDTIHDPVAASGYEVTIFENSNILLLKTQHVFYIELFNMGQITAYVVRKLFGESIELFGHIASMHSV
jgi:hypothetical protein